MLKILDISKYQPIVDYAKAAKEINGVILRIGITYWGKQDLGRDEYFEQHYKGFKAQGVPIGVYYYSAADNIATAEKEADFCLTLLKGKQFELPIYYDVENNERQGKLNREQLTAITDAFCKRVQAAGYFVGYYSYTAWLQSKFDTAYLSSKYTLWKADYRVNPDKNIACDMHQYTSGGKVNGISGRVDLNNCYKDFAAIIKASGLNGFDKNGQLPEGANNIILPFDGRNRVTQEWKGSAHYGLDIVGDDNITVRSVCNGTVESSTIITDKNNLTWQWGNYIKVVDDLGRQFFYCHLASRSAVVGQKIKAGEPLGIMGNTGYSFGAHLHLQVRDKNRNELNVADILSIPNKLGTYTIAEIEDDNMKFLEITNTNCEMFTACDVNLVDKSFNNGKLSKGEFYPLIDNKGMVNGFDFVTVFAQGAMRYVALLADRNRITHLTGLDAERALKKQSVLGSDDSEKIKELTEQNSYLQSTIEKKDILIEDKELQISNLNNKMEQIKVLAS